MRKLKRLLIIITAMTFVVLTPPSHCLAAIDSPDVAFAVNTIEAYQSVIEDLDQLYLVTFTIEYTVNPTDDASVNFLFRFLDNAVEIATTTPYAYFDSGYTDGVASFYFAATDPDLPAWGVNDISVQLLGNPSLDWTAGDPPETTNAVIDSWNVGGTLIPARIRLLANQLETLWVVDMIELRNGVLKLTDNGVQYFETVIPNLRLIAPTVFSDIVEAPVFSSDPHTLATKTTLEAKLTGTVFDQSGTATLLGINARWVYAIIWLVFSAVVLYLYATRIGTVGLTWLTAIALEVGAFSGWMPTEIAVGIGIVGGILIIYPLLFRSASI